MLRILMAMVLALVLVGGLSVRLGQTAEGACLDEPVSATGKPSSIGELARANAFFTWKTVVKEKHGKDYNAWSEATERKLVCVDLMQGPDKGKWECTRTARPCSGKGEEATSAEPLCKKETVSAYGRRRGALADAKAEAQHGWFLVVREQFGDDWAAWEKGTVKSLDCAKKTKWSYQCVAQAYPCQG